MAYFRVPQTAIDLHYEIHPDLLPRTTFFIHGNLASNVWWEPLRESLQEDSSKKPNNSGHMICAEFRGCGASTAPDCVQDMAMEILANDFVQLLKQKNLGPVNLVGHSTGGLIALLMMAQAPELFHRSVLLDPVGAKGVNFDQSMLDAFAAMKTDRKLTAAVIASTIRDCDQQSPYFRNAIAPAAQSAVEKIGSWVVEALKGVNYIELAKSVQIPTLVLHGEHDELLPMEDSKALSQSLARAEFMILKGLGHCGNIENPKLVQSYLDRFLS